MSSLEWAERRMATREQQSTVLLEGASEQRSPPRGDSCLPREYASPVAARSAMTFSREREEEKSHWLACKLCGLDIGDNAMWCNVPRAGLPSTLPSLAPLSNSVHMHCAARIREEWVNVREGYRASTRSQPVRSGYLMGTLEHGRLSSPMPQMSPINTRLSPSHSAPPKEGISRIGVGSGCAGVRAAWSSAQEVMTTTHVPTAHPSFCPLAGIPSPIPHPWTRRSAAQVQPHLVTQQASLRHAGRATPLVPSSLMKRMLLGCRMMPTR